MRVDVGGRAQVGVPEHLGDDAELLARLEQERGEGVPQTVEPLVGEASRRDGALEAMQDVRSVERPSDRRAEDVAAVLPPPAGCQALLELPEAMLARTAATSPPRRIVRFARSVLGSASVRVPRWRVCMTVNVPRSRSTSSPAEAQELALPQASADGHDIERLVAGARDGVAQDADLGGRLRLELGAGLQAASISSALVMAARSARSRSCRPQGSVGRRRQSRGSGSC